MTMCKNKQVIAEKKETTIIKSGEANKGGEIERDRKEECIFKTKKKK